MPHTHITVTCGSPRPHGDEDQAVTVRITGLPAYPAALSSEDKRALEAALKAFAASMPKDLKYPTDRPDRRTSTYWTLEADTIISYGAAGVLGNLFETHVILSRRSPGDYVALPKTDQD